MPSWSYGSWIYDYLCNQCLSPLKFWVPIPLRQHVLDTTLCHKVCQWLAAGQWFSQGPPPIKLTTTMWLLINMSYQSFDYRHTWWRLHQKHDVTKQDELWANARFGKQEVEIWRVKNRFPRYGVPIWSLWPNIRFLPSTVTEKNATKNILDGRKDGRTDGQR